MIKRIFIGFFLLVGTWAFVEAQSREFPDYRTKKESFSKLSDKGLRADLGVFTVGGIEESIGKLPLKKISPFTYTRNLMSFKGDNAEVTVTTGPFVAAGKKFTNIEDHLVKIDNKPFYGGYGETPMTAIKSVTIILNKKDTIAIPPAAYGDLYNLNFTYKDKSGTERTANGIYFSADGKRIYIYLLSRDNSGSYEVTWILENKKYLRRVLDWGFTP